MTFERQFLLASRGVALLGILALAVTQSVGPLYPVLALAAVGWTAVRAWQRRGHGIESSVANVTGAVAMVLIFGPVVLRGDSPIHAIAEFLLVLTALRLLAARNAKDWLQIYALSFFEVVAASALTIEPVFAAVFVLYLLMAPWALVLLLLHREISEQGAAAVRRDEILVDPSLFRSVAGVTVLLFLSTLTVFVFFPRMGAGLLAGPLTTGAGLTGFSDEVGLGDVTALKNNDAVAMRVMVDRPEKVRGRPQYWRGAALDAFDGRRWRKGRQDLRVMSKTRPGVFVTERQIARELLSQEVILEPMENPTIFFLGQPLQLQGRFSTMLLDALGNVRTITPAGARVQYEILSSLTPRTDPPTARSRSVPEVDPRILELAATLTEGRESPAERARALRDWFRRGFTYTMEPGDPGDVDPLARFLFETRSGHCEYFASSLAVLMRAVGIPSLVVNGYYGGEWNEYGDYLVLRQSDAHSWVEAWVGGAWQRFDPTPPSPVPGARRSFHDLQAMLDAWRMRWYRYIINYSLQDQVELTLSLRDSSRELWRSLTGELWRTAWERLREGSEWRSSSPWQRLSLVLAAAVVVLLGWILRRSRRLGRADEAEWPTRRYQHLLRLLARRGFERRPTDTPDEFLRRIEGELDGDRELVERLTALYQEARFSGRELSASRLQIDELLGRLEERSP